MAQPDILHIEKVAGRRADFVVYYSRGGVKMLDGIWATSEQDAERVFLAGCAELGWSNVVVDRVETREAGPR